MIVDRFGNPIHQAALRDPQTARVGALHHEFAEHPSRGLTPAKLAGILEQAEQGDLLAQLDLMEDMEEKDGHIHAELSKRRLAIIGLDWTIQPPRNPTKAEDDAAATLDELLHSLDWEDIVLDMADAIGKGYACLEMAGGWTRRDGDWLPETITRRPQRWFQLPQDNHWDETLRLRDGSPNGADLVPAGWITHVHKSRSGHLSRAGLHRVLAWPFLFKNYSLRDLAEFLEIYGLPLRLGTYQSGASDEEKATLLRAVVNIGHAAAGIVPEGMGIEFQEAAKGAEGPFMALIKWAETTVSKAVLGATLTSQTSESGGGAMALGNVHNEVRHDILIADARQIAQTLTRDLVWPLAGLNGLAQDRSRAPRWTWDTSEPEDMTAMAQALPDLIDIGVPVPVRWATEKLGIPAPQDDEPVLGRATPAPVTPMPAAATAALKRQPAPPDLPGEAELEALADNLGDEQLQALLEPIIAPILQLVEDDPAGALGRLAEIAPDMDDDALQDSLARMLFVAELWGSVNEDQR